MPLPLQLPPEIELLLVLLELRNAVAAVLARLLQEIRVSKIKIKVQSIFSPMKMLPPPYPHNRECRNVCHGCSCARSCSEQEQEEQLL